MAALVAACGLALLLPLIAAEPAAAAKRDRVQKSIIAADRRGTLTGSERRRLMFVWADSASAQRSMARRGSTGRAAQIAGARAIAFRLANRGQSAGQLRATLAGVEATTYVMRHRGYPTREQRIMIPGDAAVYGFYPGYGVQVHPLFTFARGNELASQRRFDDLVALTERMEDLSRISRGYRRFEYYFDWQGGRAPWVSAMAQSTALKVYARAWKHTGNARWLTISHQIIPGFGIPARRGGLYVSQGSGRWYLIYPFAPRQRILNGHLQAILGLLDYHVITGEPLAQMRASQGIRSVLPLLRRFDTGAWSRYQYGQESDLGYHDLMTLQLERIYKHTGTAAFGDYAHRFATYRSTPPDLRVPDRPFPALYPLADGWRDSVRIRLNPDKRARMTVSVRDSDGRTVRHWTIGERSHPITVIWNGRRSGGRAAGPGTYTIAVTAIDIVGNRRRGQLTNPVQVRRDSTDPEIRAVRVLGRGGSTVVRVAAHDAETPWLTARVVVRGRVLARQRIGRGGGRIVVDASAADVRRGRLLLTDSSGNRVIRPL